MNNEVIIALIPLIGSGMGTLVGILVSNKLTNYRIEQLEKKVEKHNNLIERMTSVESSCKTAHHRLDEIHDILKLSPSK